MAYEVEQKFPVPQDVESVLRRMAELGAAAAEEIQQQDLYFNHPVRDFAITDEAFRIRTVGNQNFVTYKGPKLDPNIKTRQELEIPLGDGLQVAEEFGKLLVQLGFRAVHPVRKRRTLRKLHWQDRDWELAWDQIDDLGTFIEIETIVSDPSELPAAQASLNQLATLLYLRNPERKSYLEMVLEKQAKSES